MPTHPSRIHIAAVLCAVLLAALTAGCTVTINLPSFLQPRPSPAPATATASPAPAATSTVRAVPPIATISATATPPPAATQAGIAHGHPSAEHADSQPHAQLPRPPPARERSRCRPSPSRPTPTTASCRKPWTPPAASAYKKLDWPAYEASGPRPAPRTFTAVVLENELLRLTFLPGLGGRLYRAVHKPSGRDLFYVNPVLKPTRWGPAQQGWWLGAGGIEWCLPVDEHGLEWSLPWEYSTARNGAASSHHAVGLQRLRPPARPRHRHPAGRSRRRSTSPCAWRTPPAPRSATSSG